MDFTEKYRRLKESLKSNLRSKGMSRRIAKNVIMEQQSDGTITVTLYSTFIVTFFPDGVIKCDNGGWETSTTRKWMNYYLPDGIYTNQRKGRQYIQQMGFDAEEYYEEFTLIPIEEFYDIKTDLKEKEERDKIARRI